MGSNIKENGPNDPAEAPDEAEDDAFCCARGALGPAEDSTGLAEDAFNGVGVESGKKEIAKNLVNE